MLLSILLSLLPSFLHKMIRRTLLGQDISSSARLRFLSILRVKDLSIGNNTTIGPMCYIKANKFSCEKNTRIKFLSIINTYEAILGKNTTVASFVSISGTQKSESRFHLGDHSWVAYRTVIDPSAGVFLGKHVGTGGSTHIFTHGVWGDYLDGYNSAHAPVYLEDNVWMGWQAFILPGVTVGEGSIISAASFVTRNIAPYSIVAGNPAKVVTKVRRLFYPKDKTKIFKRLDFVIKKYITFCEKELSINLIDRKEENGLVSFSFDNDRSISYFLDLPQIDHTADILFTCEENKSNTGFQAVLNHETHEAYIKDGDKFALKFVKFLREYGIRFAVNYIN